MNMFKRNNAALMALVDDPQGRRLMRLDFPRGGGPKNATLLVNTLNAEEALSQDFTIKLELLSDDAGIALKPIMGKMVTVSLVREDGTQRYFNGYVFEFSFLKTDGGFAYYEMVLKPWLAFLHLTTNCAVFQNLSVKEICERTFLSYLQRDVNFRFTNEPVEMPLAIQYNETDHRHLHRRMADAGLIYWYEHRYDGHTLWIGDDTTRALPIDGDEPTMDFQSEIGSMEDDGVHEWRPARRVGPSKVTLESYDFKRAKVDVADRPSLNQQGSVPKHEVYLSTGSFGFNGDSGGEATAKLRMEEIDARGQDFYSEGSNRYALPMRWFKLADHFSGKAVQSDPESTDLPEDKENRSYVILSVHHHASNNYHNGIGEQSHYTNQFSCLRKTIPWRPVRSHDNDFGRFLGAQTAIVVGPPGEEIHTDQYGRVRVQFHWDRDGKFNAASSVWIRVMTNAAGTNFGQISVPRVGQEVVVQFFDGNLDRPIIIGCVYNANHMPPWDLPDNKTQSGVLTRSTPGGTEANANALRFEDRRGAEEVWLHAEKDQRLEVEHDESHWVGNDRKKTVDHNETVEVKHDRIETVGHDEKITVHNNRSERVDHDEDIDIGGKRTEQVAKSDEVFIGGNRSERVMQAKEETIVLGKSLLVGGAYQTTVGGLMNTTVALTKAEEVGMSRTVIVGKSSSLSAGVEHQIVVGSSVLTITESRIEIMADEILIQGRRKVEIHGDDIDNNPG